ncbi:MAG: hypothetical protein QXR02_00295 [Acidilobaceae archaeon]
MSKPPFKLRNIIKALQQPLLVMLMGYAGVVSIAYIVSIPASQRLPSTISALVTIAGLILAVVWLLAWRTLTKTLIVKNLKRAESESKSM